MSTAAAPSTRELLQAAARVCTDLQLRTLVEYEDGWSLGSIARRDGGDEAGGPRPDRRCALEDRAGAPRVSRIAARMRARELEREHLERVAKAVRAGEEAEEVLPNPQALAGDEIRVRGLPAHMSGAPGAIRGTDPVRALLAKEARAGRRRRS